MRSVENIFALVGLAILCGIPGGSQQTSPQAGKITTTTELVLVPTIVTQKGAHLPGLTKDDFAILENGKEQKIGVFEEIRTTTDRIPKPELAAGQFANLDTHDIRRMTIIAIDMINTPTIALAKVRDELVSYLGDAAASDEPLGIVALLPGGIQVLHDVTTDKKVLMLALDSFRTHQPVRGAKTVTPAIDEQPMQTFYTASTEEQADRFARVLDAWGTSMDAQQQLQRMQGRMARISTLEALQQLAQMLAGFPGRKTVVWASASFPFAEGLFSTDKGLSTSYSLDKAGSSLDYIAYTWQLLNEANIAIYPVDARGLVNTAYDGVMSPDNKYSPSYVQKQSVQDDFRDSITTFENMATATGGKPCYGRTDLRNCFKEATQDSHDYYLLGYYVDRSKSKPGWKKLEIKTKASGVKVRARSGFFLTPSGMNADAIRKTDIGTALVSPLSYSGLYFRGSWLDTEARGAKKGVKYELQVPASSVSIDESDGNRLNMEFVATVTGKDGKPAANLGQTLDRRLPAPAVQEIRTNGIRYRNTLELEPGTYLVHFVVRDNLAARTGSVVIPLNVK